MTVVISWANLIAAEWAHPSDQPSLPGAAWDGHDKAILLNSWAFQLRCRWIPERSVGSRLVQRPAPRFPQAQQSVLERGQQLAGINLRSTPVCWPVGGRPPRRPPSIMALRRFLFGNSRRLCPGPDEVSRRQTGRTAIHNSVLQLSTQTISRQLVRPELTLHVGAWSWPQS